MKFRKKTFGAAFVSYLFFSSIALADDVVVGRDRDIPDAAPPAETETTTTESTLQQLLELFGLDIE